MLPWLLIGLPAGAIVDRLPRRSVMLVCDAASVVLLVSIPITGWLHLLSTVQLLLVTFGVGVGEVFFTNAYTAYLPTLVETKDLAEGNAKLQGSESAVQIAGPGIAGLLAQVFGAVTGVLADAVSCLVSLTCLLSIRVREVRPARLARRSLLAEIGEGARFTARDPFLRGFALFGVFANLSLTGVQAIQVVFLIRVIGLNPGTVGVLASLASCGGVLGAFFASRLSRAIGSARAVLASQLLMMPFALLIPLTHQGIWLALYVIGYGVPIAGVIASNVLIGAFRQTYCPPEMLGRISSCGRFVAYGSIPLGALLGGSLGTVLGPRATIWIMSIGVAVMPLVLLAGPVRRVRDLPSRPAGLVVNVSTQTPSDVGE
jgi:MFS family permease